MSASNIEWTERTWNPVTGCTSAVLVPSPELIARLDARRDKSKQPEET